MTVVQETSLLLSMRHHDRSLKDNFYDDEMIVVSAAVEYGSHHHTKAIIEK